jgi:hypothetical protein
MFSLDLQNKESIPNFQNDMAILPPLILTSHYEKLIKSSREICWPRNTFADYFRTPCNSNSKPMSKLDILHSQEIQYIRTQLDLPVLIRQGRHRKQFI